ncbi:hypothetical protein [Croceiramulus getboli]|nr:hypothetical protein P8624_13990 [Flavobacteriaceae bacterium YJPT1-3]
MRLIILKADDQRNRQLILDRFNPDPNGLSAEEIKSLKAAQPELDNTNTEALLRLTTEYGWSSDDRLDCDQLDIWLIFRHSQPQYFEAIGKQIEKEYRENRLDKFYYELIKDHLEGRPKG